MIWDPTNTELRKKRSLRGTPAFKVTGLGALLYTGVIYALANLIISYRTDREKHQTAIENGYDNLLKRDFDRDIWVRTAMKQREYLKSVEGEVDREQEPDF